MTEESDILSLVADKCYGGDIACVQSCVYYMYSKHEFDKIENARIDGAKSEYISKLESEESAKRTEYTQKESEVHEKAAEYNKIVSKRNGAVTALAEREKKDGIASWIKLIAIGGLVVAGCSWLMGIGGLVGAVNGLIATVSNMSFAQLGTLFILGYVGIYKGYIQTIWGKISDKFKARADKKAKELDGLKSSKETLEKEQKDKAKELATLSAEKNAKKSELDSLSAKTASEKGKLATFDSLTNFEQALTVNETAIKNSYVSAMSRATTDADKVALTNWYNQYVGAMYYGAYAGTVNSMDDFNEVRTQASDKFEEVLNPLFVDSECSDDNIRAGADARTNKPLDEMYAAI